MCDNVLLLYIIFLTLLFIYIPRKVKRPINEIDLIYFLLCLKYRKFFNLKELNTNIMLDNSVSGANKLKKTQFNHLLKKNINK